MLVRLKELPTFVRNHLLPLCKSRSIFTFTGPLGAGKTTLIREILRQLKVKKTIPSPTFGYLKSYQTPDNLSLHHFDLYRLNSLDDFLAAGFNEYLNQSNSISFIEWPEVISPLLITPDRAATIVHLVIDYHPLDQGARWVKVSTHQS